MEAGAWLAIDFAYKCQYFAPYPAYYAWSPADHPNLVGIHSNSKWARGLGRRLGWVEAAPAVIEALERVQQCSILCPDTLEQMTMARYLKQAIPSGSLQRYVDDTNRLYRRAARRHHRRRRSISEAAAPGASRRPLHRRRRRPRRRRFVPHALKTTGVLVVPGRGFGPSLTNGVRISFGPLVNDTERIVEGVSRLAHALA